MDTVRYFHTIVGITLLSLLIGCASRPENIPATYVSPSLYKSLDCDQISAKMNPISERITRLYASLGHKAEVDRAQTVGGIFFIPIWLGLEGWDGPEAEELAHLKGQLNALNQVSNRKHCAAIPWPGV
ncbi:MAG: metal ABC transporter ATP-binding protein [Magnetococcales bacterium]|nr:metal ABC transporter ATP-binding protein [Magnetococcales bacterium]